MSGTYAHDWKPGNHGGSIYYDPRRELEYWADSVPDGQRMVAVPVCTLRAAAEVRECGATHVMTHDEDGPLSSPTTIRCRQMDGHYGYHSNSYTSWLPAAAGLAPPDPQSCPSCDVAEHRECASFGLSPEAACCCGGLVGGA